MVTTIVLALALAQEDGTDFFESRIRPVLAENCLKCHGEKKSKGALRLDTKVGWEKGGESGPAVVPRKSSASLLIRMIRSDGGSPPQMPPDKPLPPSVVADFVHWVDAGAPDPRAGTASAARAIDWKAAAGFWAFQPRAASTGKSIDAFIDEGLARQALAPTKRADSWTLIRRVTFDLTGLPPTEAEVRAFTSDPSPNAFEKVLDRLLASPAYGEHQARLWLDLARYGEDQGSGADGKLTHAWRYRDWVVEAFNADLPYDRFVKLQIAADLMEGEKGDPADRRALGFIGLGTVYPRPNDLARAKAEQWDDRIDALTRTFLALTVSCARCHDHKFDPIPTRDYYSLAGILASTKELVLPIAPRGETAAYEGAAARSAEAAERKKAFLQAETDRRAREKAETFAELAIAAKADPLSHKALDGYLRKGGGRPKGLEQWESAPPEKVRELAELFQKSVLENLSKPLQQRNLDQYGALFGEKGAFPLPEKVVVDAASDEWKADYARLKAEATAAQAAMPPDLPRCHGLAEADKPVDLKVYVRGNPSKPGEPAPRRFLRVLSDPDASRFTRRHSGRLELAEAIADPENPLTARVLVNRIWQQHFGRGLVATPSNFGALGARPTHPELLDALAERFVRSGWSIKKLHREILLSEAYRRSSDSDPRGETVDPENQWLWRASRRRLTVEELRDSLLFVSGGLDRAAGGPSVGLDDPKNLRRTIYARVSRTELSPLLRLFDFPDPNLTSERRIDTTLPQQSLFLLNNPFVIERARALARVATDPETLYGHVFGRAPSEDERAMASRFLSGEDAKGLSRLERLAQVLLASNAFLYVD